MNIETIIFCNSFGIVLLVMLLCSSHMFCKFEGTDNRLFFSMVILNILGALIETISFCVDGKSFIGAYAINVCCNSFIYVANIVFPYLWLLFVNYKVYRDKEILKNVAIWGSLPALILFGSLCGNIAGGYFFTISENNVYSRGPFCMAILGFPFVYIAISVAMAYKGRKQQRCIFFPITLFLFPVVVGGIAQAMCYGISVFWTSVAIGLVAVFIAKQKEISYVDSLSNIYNRKYMSYILEQKSKCKTACAGIMIDLDYFKKINDKYGHITGDQAIADTGEIIKQAIPQNAIATRFAGDEFVIILQTERLTEVLDVIDEINYRLKKFNLSAEREYKLSFSIGYSIYVPGKNTIDQFINEMDREMYSTKRQKKIRDWHSA